MDTNCGTQPQFRQTRGPHFSPCLARGRRAGREQILGGDGDVADAVSARCSVPSRSRSTRRAHHAPNDYHSELDAGVGLVTGHQQYAARIADERDPQGGDDEGNVPATPTPARTSRAAGRARRSPGTP